jgi:hypothetical protein
VTRTHLYTLHMVAARSVIGSVKNNSIVVARKPLGPAKLTYIYIYIIFLPYLTLLSLLSVCNTHALLYPYTIAYICINHSAVVYAHIRNKKLFIRPILFPEAADCLWCILNVYGK